MKRNEFTAEIQSFMIILRNSWALRYEDNADEDLNIVRFFLLHTQTIYSHQ